MRRHRLRAAILIAAFAGAPTASAAVPCRLEAVPAFRAAREAGHALAAIEGDAARCRLVETTMIVSAHADRPVECMFRFFGRSELAPGWRLVRFATSGEVVSQGLAPVPLGADGVPVSGPRAWLVRIRAPTGITRTVSIRRVVLAGDDCMKWRQAFE